MFTPEFKLVMKCDTLPTIAFANTNQGPRNIFGYSNAFNNAFAFQNAFRTLYSKTKPEQIIEKRSTIVVSESNHERLNKIRDEYFAIIKSFSSNFCEQFLRDLITNDCNEGINYFDNEKDFGMHIEYPDSKYPKDTNEVKVEWILLRVLCNIIVNKPENASVIMKILKNAQSKVSEPVNGSDTSFPRTSDDVYFTLVRKLFDLVECK